MQKSRPPRQTPASGHKPATRRTTAQPANLQPPATGANRGSPAASVMKQFAKTRAESGGKA